jgi:phosphoglycolate phosphatase-like HAD superfamily hydrolase
MYIIYCDMDGVLVDFEKGYYDLTGTSTKQFPKGDNSFWQPISAAGAEFWANLPWMPDGKELWNYIKKYKPNILSSPSQDPSSKVGKEAWLKMNLQGGYKKAYFYSRANKQLFSDKNRILIDDLPNTINEWNAKGGIGILHTSAANTIKELKKLGL